MLTPGQDHDLTCAEPLLENADPRALLGDNAYDADPLLAILARRGITPVIPPRTTVKCSAHASTRSTANESRRALLQQTRTLSCYRHALKLARNFLAGVQLVAAIILLNSSTEDRP